jgi:hypothetical protein
LRGGGLISRPQYLSTACYTAFVSGLWVTESADAEDVMALLRDYIDGRTTRHIGYAVSQCIRK